MQGDYKRTNGRRLVFPQKVCLPASLPIDKSIKPPLKVLIHFNFVSVIDQYLWTNFPYFLLDTKYIQYIYYNGIQRLGTDDMYCISFEWSVLERIVYRDPTPRVTYILRHNKPLIYQSKCGVFTVMMPALLCSLACIEILGLTTFLIRQ